MGAKSLRNLVDLNGFEPLTTSMPSNRTSNCASGLLVKLTSLASFYRLVESQSAAAKHQNADDK